MTTTLGWGEDVQVTMELGFPINKFTLNDPTLGQLNGLGTLDGSLTPIDVSEYCKSVSISRGRPDQLQNFNAGTTTIALNNTDRRFDPINESSPYWDADAGRSGIVPRRRVQVISEGVEIFSGRITDIDVSYRPTDSSTADNSVCVITAADDFVLLANTATESDLTPANELSGARVEYILDLAEVDYPLATRNISAGTVGLGTYQIDAGTNALEYLQQVATAEQGYFYIAGNGDLTFTDRLFATFTTIAASFSDDGTEIPYTNLEVIYGQEFLYNKVIAQRVGGTPQVADDTDSQTEFGITTLTLTDLLLDDDTAAGELADDLLARYSEPEYRFDRLQTIYNNLTAAQQLTLSTLEIGDVIEITRTYPVGTPASVTKAASIEAISHTITPSSHVIEFGLAVTDVLSELILDDPVFGQLSSTNALAPSQLQPFFMDLAAVDSDFTFTA
jgi:hypothetical protein